MELRTRSSARQREHCSESHPLRERSRSRSRNSSPAATAFTAERPATQILDWCGMGVSEGWPPEAASPHALQLLTSAGENGGAAHSQRRRLSAAKWPRVKRG